ncbi:MAG: ATP-binding protein [Planctomycetota bacterium]
MSTRIDVSSSILESYEAAPLDWKTALGELIDNAFDAGATHVAIKKHGDTLSITDDGSGCDDLKRMMTIGQTYGRKGGRLGRYGIGFKEAAIWAASKVAIFSACKGMTHQWRINWDYVRAHNWDTGSDPQTESMNTSRCLANGLAGTHGTALVFEGLKHRFNGGKSLEPVLEDLGYIFSPALCHGKSIVVTNGTTKVVKPYEWPPLEHVVDRKLDVNGKSVRLVAGIVAQGMANKYPGFSYLLHHRVIQAATSMGARQYSVGRVTGRVELSDAWKVSKNKTSLVDADADALEAAIFEAMEPTLKTAQLQTDMLMSDAIKASVEKMLNQSRLKAKRKPREKTGRAKPTGEGAKHTQAARTQPGRTFSGPRNVGGVTLEFTENESHGIGRVDFEGNRIWLCVKHPFVEQARSTDNDLGIASLAAALYVDCIQHAEPKTRARYMPSMADAADGFTKGLTAMLGGIEFEKSR